MSIERDIQAEMDKHAELEGGSVAEAIAAMIGIKPTPELTRVLLDELEKARRLTAAYGHGANAAGHPGLYLGVGFTQGVAFATAALSVLRRLEPPVERCSCPVGFGAVVDPQCPRHGRREPAHTITGPANG